MKLFRAIIETAKEWLSFLKSAWLWITKRNNFIKLAQIIWMVLPYPFLFYYAFSNCSWWLVLLLLGFCFLWSAFWIMVYANMDVTSVHHYDEEKGEWVTDYEEKIQCTQY